MVQQYKEYFACQGCGCLVSDQDDIFEEDGRIRTVCCRDRLLVFKITEDQIIVSNYRRPK